MNHQQKEGWNITDLLERLVKECEKSIINLEPKNHTTKTTKSKTSKNNSN